MKRYYEKYKHIIPLAIFGVIYVLWFYLLEHRTNVQYMVVHMNIDDYIPFCEYFVVPYLLWFAYVPAVLGYLFFKDRRNYDRCAVFLCTGMLIFLVISTFIPNIQHLRLHTMPRHNVFTVLVSQLWQTDTPTNLFPSIHVYNSLGAHFAVMNNETLSGKKVGAQRLPDSLRFDHFIHDVYQTAFDVRRFDGVYYGRCDVCGGLLLRRRRRISFPDRQATAQTGENRIKIVLA